MKSLPPTVATLATASIFLLASTLTLLFTFAVPYYNPPLAIDLSGYGTCHGATLNVTKAWAWSQHPAPLKVVAIPNDDPVFAEFLGRNSIVWGSGGDLQGFTPQSWEGNVLTLDREVHVEGVCHFTLDSWDWFWESLGFGLTYDDTDYEAGSVTEGWQEGFDQISKLS
ncbi:MAG: hypothetical protein VXW72_06685 [Candidatus Thermoplasmatota archaeon]|nr:hypothetical protein [Candidatus Thermoplasmatota archaeon]